MGQKHNVRISKRTICELKIRTQHSSKQNAKNIVEKIVEFLENIDIEYMNFFLFIKFRGK